MTTLQIISTTIILVIIACLVTRKIYFCKKYKPGTGCKSHVTVNLFGFGERKPIKAFKEQYGPGYKFLHIRVLKKERWYWHDERFPCLTCYLEFWTG